MIGLKREIMVTGYEGDISSDEDVYDLDISLTMPELEEHPENDSERVGQAELEVMDFGFFAGVTLEEMDELQKMDFDWFFILNIYKSSKHKYKSSKQKI